MRQSQAELDALGQERHDNWREWQRKFIKALMLDWAEGTQHHALKWTLEYYAVDLADIQRSIQGGA